jgi:hypothetical protein
MKFLARNKTPSRFYTMTSVILWDRWTCLRWLGYLTCLVTIIQTSSYLFGYPETSLVQTVYASFSGPGILRPGQYHGLVGVGDKVADEHSSEPDSLGIAHDRRFVSIPSYECTGI